MDEKKRPNTSISIALREQNIIIFAEIQPTKSSRTTTNFSTNMYIDYSSWESFEYKVNSLELDKKNPRFDHLGQDLNQTQIIKYLISREKVYELAKKISEEGYFVGEEPIICFEKDKKIVLEGNRRVAALKILQDPKKYLSTSKANTLSNNIIKNNYHADRKTRCYIAPNRLMANPIIYERHNGFTLHRWETGNQYAFVAKMYYEDGLNIDEICEILNKNRAAILKPLKAYNLFYEGKDLLEKEEGYSIDSSSFSFTNLERFYSYEDAKEFLGIDFDDNDGSLNILIPRDEFEKRALTVFKNILESERFSREFNNDSDKDKYLKQLKENPLFDLSIVKIDPEKGKSTLERTDVENKKEEITTRRRRRSKKSSYLTSVIPRGTEIIFDNEKLDSLFLELKSLTFDKRYSFAILLRSYLEQSLYVYLETKGLLEDVGLKSKEKKNKDNTAKVKELISYLVGARPEIEGFIEESRIMSILKFTPSNNGFVDSSLKASLDYIKNSILPQHIDPMKLKNTSHFIDRIKDGLDLAVHNPGAIIDVEHNRRAWLSLEPVFQILSTDLTNNK